MTIQEPITPLQAIRNVHTDLMDNAISMAESHGDETLRKIVTNREIAIWREPTTQHKITRYEMENPLLEGYIDSMKYMPVLNEAEKGLVQTFSSVVKETLREVTALHENPGSGAANEAVRMQDRLQQLYDNVVQGVSPKKTEALHYALHAAVDDAKPDKPGEAYADVVALLPDKLKYMGKTNRLEFYGGAHVQAPDPNQGSLWAEAPMGRINKGSPYTGKG